MVLPLTDGGSFRRGSALALNLPHRMDEVNRGSIEGVSSPTLTQFLTRLLCVLPGFLLFPPDAECGGPQGAWEVKIRFHLLVNAVGHKPVPFRCWD